VVIFHSFAEFEEEEPAIRQGKEAHEEESKAGKERQLRSLSW
jgi:hypothetical protein